MSIGASVRSAIKIKGGRRKHSVPVLGLDEAERDRGRWASNPIGHYARGHRSLSGSRCSVSMPPEHHIVDATEGTIFGPPVLSATLTARIAVQERCSAADGSTRRNTLTSRLSNRNPTIRRAPVPSPTGRRFVRNHRRTEEQRGSGAEKIPDKTRENCHSGRHECDEQGCLDTRQFGQAEPRGLQQHDHVGVEQIYWLRPHRNIAADLPPPG